MNWPWRYIFFPLRGCHKPDLYTLGEKQSTFSRQWLSWECSTGSQSNHICDLHLVKFHLGFAPASLAILCIIYSGTGMYTAFDPVEGRVGGLKETKSIMCPLCMQPLLLLPVSTWTMRTRDMGVDQDRANEVCCDWSTVWKCKGRERSWHTCDGGQMMARAQKQQLWGWVWGWKKGGVKAKEEIWLWASYEIVVVQHQNHSCGTLVSSGFPKKKQRWLFLKFQWEKNKVTKERS